MATISHLDRHQADVCRLVEDVFRSMLGLAVEPASTPWSAERDLVTAVVHFGGSRTGAVLLECLPEQAYKLTSRLMGIPEPTSMNDDVKDSLGELASMIAGNLKSVVYPGICLSMPSVVEGSDYSVRICGGNIVSRLAFTDAIGSFWLALVETADDRSPAPSG